MHGTNVTRLAVPQNGPRVTHGYRLRGIRLRPHLTALASQGVREDAMQMIRKAGLGARIGLPAALAAGLAAPLLAMALAAPAGAATGPRMGSAGQTGFVVTGAQIRDVRGQVFGRNGA